MTLQQAGCDAPHLDAELLLAKVLERDRTWLIAHADDEVSSSVQERYTFLVERRRKREPLAYILGEKEFWSRAFCVTPDVLIPRPETEHLIEAAMTCFPDNDRPYRFCDMGTGSGCIAVTLACEYPQVTVTATDISHKALHIAQQNAKQHGVISRIEFRQGDMFAALQKEDVRFDAVISNPPYVAKEEMHVLEAELGFEPGHALTDDADGLHYLQLLVDQASAWLKEDGLLIVETGLCGLPSPPAYMCLKNSLHDLAGQLRGAIYAMKNCKIHT